MGVCNCSMFCCTLLYVHSSTAVILVWKRELIALLNLSSWCLVMVERFFLAEPRGCLQFVIVVFPDHTHLLFLKQLREGAIITLSGNHYGNRSVRNLIYTGLLSADRRLPYISDYEEVGTSISFIKSVAVV